MDVSSAPITNAPGPRAETLTRSRDGFLFASVTIALSSAATTGVGYIYQGAMGRFFSPAQFATLSALVAVGAIVERAFAPLEMVVAREIASSRRPAASRALVIRVLRLALVGGLLIAGALVLLHPWLLARLDAPLSATLLLAATVVVAAAGSVLVGVAHGEQKVVHLALAGLGGAILRLSASVVLIMIGLGLSGALIGHMLRTVAFVGAGALLATWRPVANESTSARTFVRRAVPVALGMAMLAIMTSVDVIAAKAWLPGDSAGHYAAASVLGKLLLLLPLAVSSVILPRIAALSGRRLRSQMLRSAVLVTAAVSVLAVLGFAMAGSWLVPLTFGPEYSDAVPLIIPIALGAALLGVGQVLLTGRFAQDDARFVWPFVGGLAVQLVWLALFHAQGFQIAFSLLAGGSVALAGATIVRYGRPARA